MRKNSFFLQSSNVGCSVGIALIVVILDSISKSIMVKTLVQGQSLRVWPGIFHLTLVANTGAAFGLARGSTPFFVVVSAIVILSVLIYIAKTKITRKVVLLSLGLILGGAVGNLIDRIRFGYVVDFLDFRVWPVFNIADSAITIGAIILIWEMLAHASNPS